MNFSQLISKISSQSRFKRDVLWNFASLAVLGGSGIVINMVILAYQGSEALGVFNQVFAFYIIVSQISVGGLQFSALKHCSYEQDNLAECAKITSSALILVSIASVVVCSLLYFFKDSLGQLLGSPDVAKGLAFAIPGLFLFSLNKVLIMVLNGIRNMRAFAIFQSLRYVLILSGVIGIMLSGYSSAHLPLSLTIAESFLFIFLVIYINFFRFRLVFSLSEEMWAWFKKHLSFGSRGFLSGVLIEMNTRVDVLMLGYFMSDKFVGIYSFASTFAEGFAQLTTVIRQNVDPIVGKCFSENKTGEIVSLAQKIRRKFFPLMILGGVALVAGFPAIIWFLSSDADTAKSWGVFAILVFGIASASAFRPFIALLLQGGRPGTFTLLIASTVICNIILNYVLIPVQGIYGAAMATSAVYILEALAIVILAQKLFGIKLYMGTNDVEKS